MNPVDLLLLVLVIVGFLAVNFFVQRSARSEQRRRAITRAVQQTQAVAAADDEMPEVADMRKQEAAASAAAPLTSRHVTRSRFFHSEADLRHAIVVLTVLGPCRAREAYEPPGQ